ncbi:putative sporulation protein YtxC [Sporohalobacter salinus]|uniref:putative sporulation protein YtxC n=1 Tax=Sporohalobacter salinus TaxID=1494606 RepID=UPI0019619339|nr:putative sporulation protein YtxC [Sporohalobacter salinus]MBM7625092.1 putative sporulation protein YtxC [Sporohalobacter salinus]
MESISIGINYCKSKFKEKLKTKMNFLANKGLDIVFTEEKKGLTFFNCGIENLDKFMDKKEIDEKNINRLFKDYLISVVSETVIEDLEPKLIKKIIQQQYKKYDQTEKQLIYQLALQRLSSIANRSSDNLLTRINKRDRIQSELFDYLEDNNKVIIDGFIRFRLQDYLTELETVVKQAVDDYIIEREYEEFVSLLRYFVDIQDPKFKLVHVVKNEDSGFKLLNSHFDLIENDYLEGFSLDMKEEALDYEDLLISALIAIAPRKIILHFNSKNDIVATVKNIFIDKAKLCTGCEYCSSLTNSKVLQYEK